MQQKPKSASQLLLELTDSLNQATGAASAFVHLSGNAPGFMILRDSIDLVRSAVNRAATARVIAGEVKQ